MKKTIILIGFLFANLLAFNQTVNDRSATFHVSDSTTNFNANLRIGTLVFDEGSNKLWKITAQGFGTDNLSTVTKVLVTESGVGGESLEQTLSIGNTTGSNDILISDGQVLKALNGSGSLDLRNGDTDGDIMIKNDSANIHISGQEIRFTGGIFFGTPYFGSLASTAQATLLSFGTGTFTRVGEFGLINNDNGNISSLDVDNFPTKASSRNVTFNQDIVNSFAGGGTDIIVKTNNSTYANQYIFNTGEAFETVLRYDTPTAERDIKLPDNSGTIALTSDVVNLFNSNGTIGPGRIATLTDDVTYLNGMTNFLQGTTSKFLPLNSTTFSENKTTNFSGGDVYGSTNIGHVGNISASNSSNQAIGFFGGSVWTQSTGGFSLTNAGGSLVGISAGAINAGVGSITRALGVSSSVQALHPSGSIDEAICYAAVGSPANLGAINSWKGFFMSNISSITGMAADSNRYGIYIADVGRNYFKGNVGIGNEYINPSAKLEITSTTQGFLPPRMDTVQMNAIPSPAEGLIVYNTSDSLVSFYNGSVWDAIHDKHIHGAQGFSDSSITLSMTQNEFIAITNTDNNLYTVGIQKGAITFVGDTVIIGETNDYEINYDISFSGANADEYHIAIFINGVQQFGKGETIRDMVTNEIQPVTSHTILSLNINDGVCIALKNINNNNDATIVAGNLTIKKL